MTVETFKKGTFKIAVNPRAAGASSDDGTRTGLINGVFGITGSTGRYAITHLASGYLCAETRTQQAARSLCATLTAVPGINWSNPQPFHTVTEAQRVHIRSLIQGASNL